MTSRNLHAMRRSLALLVLASAGVLMTLAWPRLHASWTYLPVDTALAKYFATREIPTAQLQPLIGVANDSLRIHNHFRFWEGLSLLHYLHAQDAATPGWERRPALRRSLRAARESVRRAPANPRVWLRMARIQAVLGAPEDQVLPPLRMSILTGRVEPNLMLSRLELGYRYHAGLDAETVALLRDQTVLAWRVEPARLIGAIRAGRLDFERMRALLSGNEDILAEMEARIDPAS